MIWSPARYQSKCQTLRLCMPAGALSWLSRDAGDAFPQVESVVGCKGDVRSMRSGLGASITLARRIGLLFSLLSVSVSHRAV